MKKLIWLVTMLIILCTIAGCSSDTSEVILYDDLTLGMNLEQIVENQGREPDNIEDIYGTTSITYINKEFFGFTGDMVLELIDESLYRIILQATNIDDESYNVIKAAVIESYPVDVVIEEDTIIELGDDSKIIKYTYIHDDYEISISNQEHSKSVNIIFTSK